MTKTALLSAIAIGMIAATSPARAGVTSVSATVEYGDLDLTTDEGAAALERRIADARRNLCSTYDRSDKVGPRPFARCMRAARADPSLDAILADARKDAGRQTPAVAAR